MTQQNPLYTISDEGNLLQTASMEFVDVQAMRESVSGFLTSVGEFYKLGKLKEAIFGVNEEAVKLGFVQPSGNFKKYLETADYVDFRVLKAYAPAGLNVKYKVYVDALGAAVEASSTIIEDILNPFSRYLAANLTNPEEILKGNGVAIKGYNPHDLDAISTKLGKCFKKGSNRTEFKVGDLFDNKADIQDVLDKAGDINATALKINRKQIIAKMNEISDLLDRLAKVLEDEEYKDISKRAADILYKLSYTTARELEFVSVTFYQLTAFNQAISDTTNKVVR